MKPAVNRLPGFAVRAGFCVDLALLAVGFAGCGGEPFSLGPVSGKVTYSDGTAIRADEVHVTFIPQDVAPVGNDHPLPGDAVLDADGSFSQATTHRQGDGVIVGRHKVVVLPLVRDGFHKKPLDGFPKAYTNPDTTPLEVEVTRGKNHFELTVDRGQ